MRGFGWYLLLLLAVLAACKSAPSAEEAPLEEPFAVEQSYAEDGPYADGQPYAAGGPSSNSVTVTQEVYDVTLADVKHFVDGLNSLINRKNYNGWKNALSDELFARISSPEFLSTASESNLLRSRKIVLNTPDDYFLQVVVPSRSNSRVDEIEFIATDRVKVYYLEKPRRSDSATAEPRRLRLYELVKDGDTWKIID